ncbi:hypothetical protein V3C99_011221 [Haemonchus contortus]
MTHNHHRDKMYLRHCLLMCHDFDPGRAGEVRLGGDPPGPLQP